MRVATIEEFFDALRASQLLTVQECRELEGEDNRNAVESPEGLAQRLVARGLVTSWQANELLAGRSTFFFGKYKLLKELGRGGMGAVYQAEHAALKRTVALKVMAPQFLRDTVAVSRFQREIQAAAALDDPHIVAAYDAESVGDMHFLVMEFVPGRTLEDLVKGGKSLSISRACEYIRQAALGLAHAHERGMAHRDIKPANLLLTSVPDRGELVKILDMGLARFASESRDDDGLTRTGQIMGTPDYIAPEQAQNTRNADIRSDIFSLGCTLFRLLTGRVPFEGENVMAKLMARALHDAPRVQSLRPEISNELDAVVARMLARDPDLRYQHPGEVARALAPIAHASDTVVAGRTSVCAGGTATGIAGEPRPVLDPLLSQQLRELAGEANDTKRSVGSSGTPTISARRGQRLKSTTWGDSALHRKLAIGGALAVATGLTVWLWPRQPQPVATRERPTGRVETKSRAPEETPELVALKLAVDKFLQAPPDRGEKNQTELDALWDRGIEFELRCRGTSEAIAASRLLARLPAPADTWNRESISEQALRVAGEGLRLGAPHQIVGILGDITERSKKPPGDSNTPLVCFTMTANGRTLIVGNAAGELAFRNFSTGQPERSLPGPFAALRVLTLSNDGQRLAVATGDNPLSYAPVTVWDFANGKLLYQIRERIGLVMTMAFSRDDQKLLIGDFAGMLSIYDASLGIREQVLDLNLSPTDRREIFSVAFSPHGEMFATVSWIFDRAARIWDWKTRRERFNLEGHVQNIYAVAFTPDGRSVVTASQDGTARLWNAETGKQHSFLKGQPEPITALSISPTGDKIALGGAAGTVTVITMLEETTAAEIYLPATEGILQISFTPDGRHLVTANATGTLYVLRLESWTLPKLDSSAT